MAKKRIFMGIPSNGNVIDSQAYILREIAEHYADYVEIVYPKVCVRRVFHDFARNALVDEFLESDCDAIWFLDSDITPMKYVMDLVALHWDKWKVAGATYPVFMTPPGMDSPEVVFTAYTKNAETGNLTLARVPKEGQEFVDGLATGCLFIKREVFSQLSKPYFEFKFDPTTRNMIEGEDLGFCRKLSDLGIKVFTDFSLVCKHQKSVDLLDMNNYAISYSNRNVMYAMQVAQEEAMVVHKAGMQEAFNAGIKHGLLMARKAVEAETKPKPATLWTPSNEIVRSR